MCVCESVGRDQHRYESTPGTDEKSSSVNAIAAAQPSFENTFEALYKCLNSQSVRWNRFFLGLRSPFVAARPRRRRRRRCHRKHAALAIPRCFATLTDILMFYTQKVEEYFFSSVHGQMSEINLTQC